MSRNIDKNNVVKVGTSLATSKTSSASNGFQGQTARRFMENTVSALRNYVAASQYWSKTAGYDSVIVINEKLINEASAALFYSNFLTFNGNMDFSKGSMALPQDVLKKVPSTLNGFLKVRYRCKMLYEPIIDFKADKTMSMNACLRLYVWMMDGLELRFDASLGVSVPLSVSLNRANQIAIPFTKCKITEFKIRLKGSQTDVANIDVAKMFSKAINDYLTNTTRALTIELPVYSTYLPYTPHSAGHEFKINLAAVEVIDSEHVAVGINFLNHTGGNKSALRAFAPNSNLAFALSKKAMLDTYDFFWNHTTWNKYINYTTTFHVDLASKVVEYGFKVQDIVTTLVSKMFTLGFLEVGYEFEDLEFFFTFQTALRQKPGLDFIGGNVVEITNLGEGIAVTLEAVVHYIRTVEVDTSGAIPDKCTPWKDDIVVSKRHEKKRVFKICLGFNRQNIKCCRGKLYLDESDRTLKVNVEKLTFGRIIESDCILRDLGDRFTTWLLNKLSGIAVPMIPPIVVSPAIGELNIPGVNVPMSIEGKKLDIDTEGVVAGAYLAFDKMKTVMEPMPKYVGNTNTMEVHRLGCDCIYDAYETHQRGFYSLQKALSAGFDGCKKCLRAYHRT